MTRFLPVFSATAAIAYLFFVGQAMAQQSTRPSNVNVLPEGTPVPSYMPPTNLTPQVQGDIRHARNLVTEVRENTENVQKVGNFAAQLWLVEGQQFFDDWRKPGVPSIDPATTVLRGQTISTVIIFSGMAQDNKGLSNVHYDVVVKRPNGTIYEHRDDLIGWQDLTPTGERRLLLGRNSVSLNFSLDDPAGIYSVEASVHDNVGRQDLVLKQTFVLQ